MYGIPPRRPWRWRTLAIFLVITFMLTAWVIFGLVFGYSPFHGLHELVLSDAPTATPMPTPRAIGEYTTYTNATYGYSVKRPDGWVTQVAGGSGENVTFSNYNPATMNVWPGPPLYQIEIDADENPTKLAPLAFFIQQMADYPDLHTKIISESATTLAGRSAERIVSTTDASIYPDIQYLVARHNTMYLITEDNAVNGQPSSVFNLMVASFTFTG